MKKLLHFVFAALAFVACTQNDVEELSANRQDVPETLTVGFEGSDDTRIQLNEAQKTVWTKDDLVSVFYRSNANQKWQYQGETGERVGNLKRVDNILGTLQTTKTIVVYPYSENYWLNTDSYYIDATLPAVQHYAEDSYGIGDNLMVSQSEFTQFSLKSVCGWLKIQLAGNGEKVQSITLRGNNEEQVAGLIYVDTATAESTLASKMGSADDNNAGGNLVFDDTIVTELTLDCGEGVVLGAESKAFYIAVPPQTFEQGFTVEVECDNGTSTTKSTSEPITIERNHIKPMEAIEYDGVLPEVYELAYRTNDGKALAPITTEGFGGEFEENIFDAATGEGKLVFAGAITTIPNQAFGLCENLTWIEIPLGVTSIGASAFSGCSSMEEITIPASVASVGEEAFYNCTGKAYINCSGVSFRGAGFAEVVIGDSVTTIGNRAFYDCDSLTSVTIGDSVTTIGNRVFYHCSSLTSVIIPDSVTTIGEYAFYRCTSLTSITIPDSVTTIGNMAFEDCDSLISVTIPDNVTTIGSYAFCSCDSLTSVYCEATTPPSLDGSYVFDNNASDRTIYVPEESVRQYKIAEGWSEYADAIVGYDFENGVVVEPEVSINNEIHYTATAKVEAHSSYPWTFYTFGANILSHNFNEESGEGIITFDADVTTIRDKAFYSCDSLTSITIPDSVTTIGGWAFYHCNSITSITIGDSVTTIGEYAFCECDSLTSVTIPDSVTTIGYEAFYGCDSLTSITIPDSVTTIGGYAFQYCDKLTSVTIGDSVTTIGDRAFYSCDSLTSVTIPDSVTTIGGYAFSSCGRLTSVTIGDGVTTIGDNAFYDCDSLTSVTIGDSVTTIEVYAFSECDSLTSITIPDSVTTIGSSAFSECDSLTSVTIPDSVTTIGDCAFEDCDSLTSVTIPDSVTTIGDRAFYDCDSLTSVIIPDSVTSIGYRAFYGCDSLTSVRIGNSVTTIGEGAFSHCDSLTSVTIGDSVTTIGDYAFHYCYSLTSVYCEATTPPSLGASNVFDVNASSRTIYIPAASVEAYKTAEYWSEYADAIVGYDF